MKVSISALAATAALAFAATSANAATTVSFTGYGTALNPGEAMITGFEGGPGLGAVTFNLTGFTLGGTAALWTGSTDGVSAAPALNGSDRDPTQYLSIQGGKKADLTTPFLSSISFYVGSLDGYNSFSFLHQNGTTEVFAGTLLDLLPATDANGNQTGNTTNGRLRFTFDNPIQSVTMASTTNALEISDIAGKVAAVPEPATWAFMIMGFGGIGALMRRQRSAAAVA